MIIITINVIILKSDKEIFKSYISFLGDVFGSGLYKVQATNQKNILCIFIYTCIDRYLYTCIEDWIGVSILLDIVGFRVRRDDWLIRPVTVCDK